MQHRLRLWSFGRAVSLWLALLALGGGAARAAITYTIGVPTITNHVSPGYVIDSDATRGNTNYFRHLLPVRMPVTVIKTGAGSESSVTMAVRFGLRNLSTGQLHPLQGGATNVTTSPQSAFFLSPGTNTLNFNTNLIPSARLDPFANYRVETEVFQTSNGGVIGTNQSVDRTFIHFRGPWGTDTEMNVVAALNSVLAGGHRSSQQHLPRRCELHASSLRQPDRGLDQRADSCSDGS